MQVNQYIAIVPVAERIGSLQCFPDLYSNAVGIVNSSPVNGVAIVAGIINKVFLFIAWNKSPGKIDCIGLTHQLSPVRDVFCFKDCTIQKRLIKSNRAEDQQQDEQQFFYEMEWPEDIELFKRIIPEEENQPGNDDHKAE